MVFKFCYTLESPWKIFNTKCPDHTPDQLSQKLWSLDIDTLIFKRFPVIPMFSQDWEPLDLWNAMIFANNQFMNEHVIQFWSTKMQSKAAGKRVLAPLPLLPLHPSKKQNKNQETKRLAESLGLKISQRQAELPNQTKGEQKKSAQLLSFHSPKMVNFPYCLNQIDNFSVISNGNILKVCSKWEILILLLWLW